MVEVIVSFRDAVFAALMSWGGVSPGMEANASKAVNDTPVAPPAVIEETVDSRDRRFC